jgi:DNA replication protein DnaC
MPDVRVAARYENGSIVLSTSRRFKEWGAVLDSDNTFATAMIDRLMHRGAAVMIGASHRMIG